MATQNQTQQKLKKLYAAPKLINYGSVRSLTQGGTKANNENNTGNNVKNRPA